MPRALPSLAATLTGLLAVLLLASGCSSLSGDAESAPSPRPALPLASAIA